MKALKRDCKHCFLGFVQTVQSEVPNMLGFRNNPQHHWLSEKKKIAVPKQNKFYRQSFWFQMMTFLSWMWTQQTHIDSKIILLCCREVVLKIDAMLKTAFPFIHIQTLANRINWRHFRSFLFNSAPHIRLKSIHLSEGGWVCEWDSKNRHWQIVSLML